MPKPQIDAHRFRAVIADVGCPAFAVATAAGFSPSCLSRALRGQVDDETGVNMRGALEEVLGLPADALAPSRSRRRAVTLADLLDRSAARINRT